jgi:hypothetical protein
VSENGSEMTDDDGPDETTRAISTGTAIGDDGSPGLGPESSDCLLLRLLPYGGPDLPTAFSKASGTGHVSRKAL